MPLTPPVLDDRTFEDLVREARARITRYNPAWTDFNDSDPGFTLVQLFAWLTELMLYRVNQVPDRSYLKFLQMLNFELRPAEPAVARLVFANGDPSKNPSTRSIPAFTAVSADNPTGGAPLVFETEHAIDFAPRPLGSVQTFDGIRFSDVTALNSPDEQSYWPLGRAPQSGHALMMGFDTLPIVQGTQPDTAPFPPQLRLRVFLPPDPREADRQNESIETLADSLIPSAPPGVRIVWEYKPSVREPWRRLGVIRDESAAFTREGDIVIEAPNRIEPTLEGKKTPVESSTTQAPAAEPAADDAEPPTARYWLRARLDRGSYPAGQAPLIDFVAVNVVSARNLSTVVNEVLGESNGQPDQTYRFERRPVQLDESLQIEITTAEDPDSRETWERREDFLASRHDDAHYVVNATSGEIRFGDGERGKIPPAAALILAARYRHGGGAGGNTPASTIINPLGGLGQITVSNPRAAAGGRDEEPVDALRERAPALIRSRYRAVTEDDFRALAEAVGGVARSECLARYHPDFPDLGTPFPGAITVLAVPDTDDPAPALREETRRAIARQLQAKRLVGTEVFVRAPRYHLARVTALVQARRDLAFGELELEIARRLNEFLDPLGRVWGNDGPRRYKDDGVSPTARTLRGKQNERFGQDLHPSRFFGEILAVPGVTAVKQMLVEVDGRPIDISGGESFIVRKDALCAPSAEPHEIHVIAEVDR